MLPMLGRPTILAGLLLAESPRTMAENIVVEWEAPAECPQHEIVRARIEQLLGNSVASSSGEHFAATGVVRPSHPPWILDLAISTADGTEQRILEAESCEALAEAASVVISIALAPRFEIQPSPPPATETTPSGTLAGPTDAAGPTDRRASKPKQPRPPKDPRSHRPLRPAASLRAPTFGFVRAVGGLSIGPLPGPAALAGLGLGLRRRRFRAELLGRYNFSRTAERDGVGGTVAYWGVLAHACFVPAWRIVDFPLCAGVDVGAMTGRGIAAQRATRSLPWVAADANVGLLVHPIPRIGLGFQIDLLIPATRPGFAIEGIGVVHRAASVGATAAFGVEVQFP